MNVTKSVINVPLDVIMYPVHLDAFALTDTLYLRMVDIVQVRSSEKLIHC